MSREVALSSPVITAPQSPEGSSYLAITPPPPTSYSPIVNSHLEYAKKVLAEGRKIGQLENKKGGQKRTSCSGCKKTFVRINAHKCKGNVTTELI